MSFVSRPALILLVTTVFIALSASSGFAAETTVTAGSELLSLPADQRNATLATRVAATALAWPGGHLRLRDAVATLDGSGNPTRLAAGVDGDQMADVALGDGTYWSAALAVCTAFKLAPLPAPTSEDDGYSSMQMRRPRGARTAASIALGGGVLVLGAETMPGTRRSACGPLLIEMLDATISSVAAHDQDQPTRWFECGVRLRVEPHNADGVAATAALSWTRTLVDGQPAAAPEVAKNEDATDSGRNVLRVNDPPALARRLGFTGSVTLTLIEPLHLTPTMRPGDTVTVTIGTQKVSLQLLDAESVKAKRAGNNLGDAGSLLASYPSDLLARRAVLALLADGKAMPAHGSGRSSNNRTTKVSMNFGDLADREYTATLDAALTLGEVALPIDVAIDLTSFPTKPRALPDCRERATAVQWPAGRRTLKEALAALNTGGNTVVLDLGSDTQTVKDLPAFTGCFWQGVLTLCAAYELELLPPSTQRTPTAQSFRYWDTSAVTNAIGTSLGCGAVRLARAHSVPNAIAPATATVCGPLLAEVASVSVATHARLDGVSRELRASVRLRLEPRFDDELVCEPMATWATAGDCDGTAIALGSAMPGGNDQESRMRLLMELSSNPQQSHWLDLVMPDLPSNALRAHASGQLAFRLRRELHSEANLAPGESTPLMLGGHAVTVTLGKGGAGGADDDGGDGGNGGNRDRDGVTLSTARQDQLDDLVVTVRTPAGTTLTGNGRGSSSTNGRTEMTYHFDGITNGKHLVTITGKETLAAPVLPFAVVVEMP